MNSIHNFYPTKEQYPISRHINVKELPDGNIDIYRGECSIGDKKFYTWMLIDDLYIDEVVGAKTGLVTTLHSDQVQLHEWQADNVADAIKKRLLTWPDVSEVCFFKNKGRAFVAY